VHLTSFPHPFLRSLDDYTRRIYPFIKLKDGLEKENICPNCGKKFSIFLFKQVPKDQQSKRIFDICNGEVRTEKNKPLFEKFLKWFFIRFEKIIFNYKIFPTTQSILTILSAFILLGIPYCFYLLINGLVYSQLIWSPFDNDIIIIFFLTSLVLIFLFNLIKENDSKLSLNNLDLGLHDNYKRSNWGIAFNESFLKGLAYKSTNIPLINKSIFRPTFSGLTLDAMYLLYKISYLIFVPSSDYSKIVSVSLIPFWLLVFFIIGYSVNYSISSSDAIRIIIRELNLKVRSCTEKDNYLELGELWELSIMIFIVITFILFTLIVSLNHLIIFINITQFILVIGNLLFIMLLMGWIWIASFIELRDKYQIEKNDELTNLKNNLEMIKNKTDLTIQDSIESTIIISKINSILSKPSWPIRQPYLLLLLPLISPILLVLTGIGNFISIA